MELPAPPDFVSLSDRGSVALFLDFDGTLVEIASTPDAIRVPDDLSEALNGLNTRLDGKLALVSGRSLVDLVTHLGPLSIARAGSHGADVLAADGSPLGAKPQGLSQAASDDLTSLAKAYDGVTLEHKPHGLALHYRAAPQLGEALMAATNGIAARHGCAVSRGKCVIELLSSDANKGTAVRALLASPPFADAMPVFIGDDVTDDDGFRACADAGGFGIAIGERETSEARYRLASPAALREWLSL
jgi:trehalose 6-phosphate phosphatase